MQTIYEPKGRAQEYSSLAVNLYRGCGHGCQYCYAPQTLKIARKEFYYSPAPRKDIIAELKKKLEVFSTPDRYILLSFTSDPYQPLDQELKITRQAIELLKLKGCKIEILTKAGLNATRDFDLLDPAVDKMGTTLTFAPGHEDEAWKWEPHATLPTDRIPFLFAAKNRGFQTWVSLEPVIDPAQSLRLIDITHEYVDYFKVGILNHHVHAKTIDWKRFGNDAVEKLTKYGKEFMLKDDLIKKMQ